MKYTVIIPTLNRCEDLLKPCIESIFKYSTMKDTEIIVVANGCTDNTYEYVSSLQTGEHTIHHLDFPEPLGYTRAINEGLKVARGEFIVLLNNDTILLDQPKDQWLEILNKPFEDLTVGLTGPMKVVSESCGREFLIFFCVMIRKAVFEGIGLLDETFSPGYGEDTDFCLRAEEAGWDVLQVPEKSSLYYAEKRMTGNFPIYHAGNETFKDHPDAELIHRNNKILSERWFTRDTTPEIDISRAQKCDGFMSDEELRWLGRRASQSQIFIEVGSWHGKSSRAIADNLPPGGKLYCIDHWLGSLTERDTNHESAKWENGDHAYMEFCNNLFDHIQAGRVIPLRMHSSNAVLVLKAQGVVRADTVFIDAGHIYKEVAADIRYWKWFVKDDGILCGHDYYESATGAWPGVRQAVDESFPKVTLNPGTSIWSVLNPPPTSEKQRKPAVFDCFPFNNELDILEERFKLLYIHVDRFIIVEAKFTHAGKPKELVFNANLNRFSKYLDKITYGVVEYFPETQGSVTDKSWARERYQRDSIMHYLRDCHDEDVIIISDCDEIPDPIAISLFKNLKSSPVSALEMDLYYYDTRTKAKDKWLEAKVCLYAFLKEHGPCGVRYFQTSWVIPSAGNHFSYFGGPEAIIHKIEDTAHQEYATPYFLDRDRVERAVKEGTDIFERPSVKFERL